MRNVYIVVRTFWDGCMDRPCHDSWMAILEVFKYKNAAIKYAALLTEKEKMSNTYCYSIIECEYNENRKIKKEGKK